MLPAKLTNCFSVILWSFLCLISYSSSAQVGGCKDPAASNYDPAVTENDGSCTYAVTSYTPPVKVDPISSTLSETSGLQMAGNYLWSFNDGGHPAAIYRIDTLTSTLLQTVNLQGATNVDWEDMAFDGTYFYIGDFGNNATGARTDLKIYKFKLSDIPADFKTNPTVTLPPSAIEIIHFSYSDQPAPLVATATSNSTKYDCEAMIVDGGKIHLFTKNWIDLTTTHYVINSTAAGTYAATPVETLSTGFLVTGADKVPDKNVVALIGYINTGFGNHYMYLLSDFSGGTYFNGNKRKLNLPTALDMGQAEGIAFQNSTYGYISNEQLTKSGVTIHPKLHSFNMADFVPLYVLPVDLVSFRVTNENKMHKIAWSFAEPVQHLKVQSSSNGSSFTDISTYTTSTSGVYYNKATATTVYYRLAWQKHSATYKYSPAIRVSNSNEAGISHITLQASGRLAFTVSGRSPVACAFQLVTTDGVIWAQIQEQAYVPGSHMIHFLKEVPPHRPVFLTIRYETGSSSQLMFPGE